MYRFSASFFVCILLSCSTDALNVEETLGDSLSSKKIVQDNVIACAATNADSNIISVFFYPRTGVSNYQYFETENITVDKNDFDNYLPVVVPVKDVFNGYLKKFEITSDNEKWVIVSFDENGQTHVSNPIRLKHKTKPTEYLPNNIGVEFVAKKPDFSWQDGTYKDTKIYFQVVSDVANNLLSGTYTYDKSFQYYSLDNVVLNITTKTPSELIKQNEYHFTLMAVSEDNWVNFFSEILFSVE